MRRNRPRHQRIVARGIRIIRPRPRQHPHHCRQSGTSYGPSVRLHEAQFLACTRLFIGPSLPTVRTELTKIRAKISYVHKKSRQNRVTLNSDRSHCRLLISAITIERIKTNDTPAVPDRLRRAQNGDRFHVKLLREPGESVRAHYCKRLQSAVEKYRSHPA